MDGHRKKKRKIERKSVAIKTVELQKEPIRFRACWNEGGHRKRSPNVTEEEDDE